MTYSSGCAFNIQRSTFHVAHSNTHCTDSYTCTIHNTIRSRRLRIQMSAPYTTPNSGTFLASAGVPTGASHDTTRRSSLSPPALNASCIMHRDGRATARRIRTDGRACTPAPRSSTAAGASLASARRWGDRPAAHVVRRTYRGRPAGETGWEASYSALEGYGMVWYYAMK